MEVRNTYDIVDDKIGRIYVGRRGFYGLVSKTINVNRKCPLCGGNKKIKLNGEMYTCPKCEGRTTGENWYSYSQYSLVEFYIDSIMIQSTSYISSICSVETNQSRSDFSIIFSECDYNKRSSSFRNKVSSRDFPNYILTADDVDFDHLSKLLGSLYYIKFTDKSTASKLQRMLNKSEKERVAEYVEEAKRLKETTSEFSYEL